MDSNGKNRVLIVDDEKMNIEVLGGILQRDYTILMAKNGAAAIEMAAKFLPDIILLDVIMPDMNGFDALTALKASDKTRHIPVIIITGLNSVEDEERGLSLGASDFIHKPFSVSIVRSRVHNQIQLVNKIRELVRLQQELEAAVKAAESANRTKSAFLAKMSHEIRASLNAILGISEIHLQDENDRKYPKEIKEAFGKIFNSGDMLLGIINDILDMSKIEAGKLELIRARYDVASLINDTVFLNMIKYENKPIYFTLTVDENVPSALFGDELRIKQVLNNLLSNAFKYTNSGEVELSVAAENSADTVTLVFRVRDTGQGMTTEQIARLFDEYSRFNPEADRATEGTGLGMSITRNLIRMMNGEIMAESEPGKGSLFTVRLPQGNLGAPAPGIEPEMPQTADTGVYDGILDAVGAIDEINMELGLGRFLGNKDMYCNTLDVFNKNLPAACNNMSASLETKDLKNFMVIVHAIKSQLATVGAMGLSETASDLETASKNQETEFCEQQYPGFKKKLLSLHRRMSEIFPGRQSLPKKGPGDRDLLRESAQKALAAVKNLDTDTGIEIIKALLPYDFGGEINVLLENALAALENFEYEGTAGILREIDLTARAEFMRSDKGVKNGR